MRKRSPLARRFFYAAVFFVIGISVIMTIAWWQNPPERCEEGGGIWHIDGRWCEAAELD